jgi:threonine dehydrogenase-like Zn-dependent dehydrogenase
MKAFAMLKIGESGWIEKPRPKCGPLDAILRPLVLAPCSSDAHTILGAVGEKHNAVLGHEGTGIVDEVGELVEDFKPGDRVIIPAITPDWLKNESQDGYQQHSGGMLAGYKFTNLKDGVFAEYIHVNEADGNLEKLPDEIDPAVGAMISDMVPTGLHGAEIAEVRFGDDVVVIGIGPVGLMSVAGAIHRGAARLFAVGSRPNCVQVAKEYGATDIIDYHNGDIVEQIMKATNGQGVDRVILAGGDNETFTQGMKMLKPGGNLGNVNYFDNFKPLEIPMAEWGMGMAHKKINGGLMPGGRERMRRLANMVKHGRLDPSKLITHRFEGFDKIGDAVQMMIDKPKDLIKPVIVCEK